MKYYEHTDPIFVNRRTGVKFVGSHLRNSYRVSSIQMLRPHINIFKMYWEFHKGDADYFPSVPHGHCLSPNFHYLKLELWSGKIIDSKKKCIVGTAAGDDMRRLYQYKEFLQFVNETRQAYKEQYPKFPLEPLVQNLGWSYQRNVMIKKNLSLRKNEAKQTFKFLITTKFNANIHLPVKSSIYMPSKYRRT